jgi:hypothetical protein
MTTYGHRHLGLFFWPFVEVREDGFLFHATEYDWGDIERVEVYDSPLDPLAGFFFAWGYPTATIYLRDGKNIRLKGRALEQRGVKAEVGFLSGKSDAFRELIALLESHGASNTRRPRVIMFQLAKLTVIALVSILLIFATLGYLGITL